MMLSPSDRLPGSSHPESRMSKPAKADKEAAASHETNVSFEQALKRLEELVRQLEQGNVPLEQSLAAYAEAVKLLQTCQKKLDAAETQIEVLSGVNAQGQPTAVPLGGHAELSLDEKREARSARRSAEPPGRTGRAPRRGSDVDEPEALF